MGDQDWVTYVLRCADDSLYCGVTTSLERRLHEHNHTARGARYTRVRRPVAAIAWWHFPSRAQAQSFEARFKKLDRSAKLRLVAESAAPADQQQG